MSFGASKTTTVSRRLQPKYFEAPAEEEDEEDGVHHTAVCFLDPNSVRWMNRRRKRGQREADGTMTLSQQKPLVTPSQALYLGGIFKGLDYDNQGWISLSELSAAVRYVSKHSDGKVFPNPNKIIRFFEEMDIDGNGNVDLNEFLIGMTAQANSTAAASSDPEENVMGSNQLQKSFADFANLHRRRKIIAGINNEGGGRSEMQRYANLHALFGIRYLASDTDNDSSMVHGNVEEQINRAKEDLKEYKKNIAAEHHALKKVEGQLTRSAALYFCAERDRQHIGQRTNDTYLDPSVEQVSGLGPVRESNQYRHDYSIEKSIALSKIPQGGVISRRLENKVNEKLSHYPLLRGERLSMNKTHTPQLTSVLPAGLDAPNLPRCFGPLTSGTGGGKVLQDMDDVQNAAGRPGMSPYKRRSGTFATRNIPLEMRLQAQLVRNSPTTQEVMKMSESGKFAFTGDRGGSPINMTGTWSGGATGASTRVGTAKSSKRDFDPSREIGKGGSMARLGTPPKSRTANALATLRRQKEEAIANMNRGTGGGGGGTMTMRQSASSGGLLGATGSSAPGMLRSHSMLGMGSVGGPPPILQPISNKERLAKAMKS